MLSPLFSREFPDMLSLKKYFLKEGEYILAFVLMLFFGALSGGLKGNTGMGVAIAAAVCLLIGAPFFIYYLWLIVITKRHLPSAEMREGRIVGWNMSPLSRTAASVYLTDGGIDHSTASVFSRYTAPEMVGKSIRYCIIEDYLVIDEILE